MFLSKVWHLDVGLDLVTGLWYKHDPIFCSLSGFWRCKKHPCPSSPHLGLWRMIEVPDWGLAFWSWFGYDHWSLIYPWSKFWLSILILKVPRTCMSYKSWFRALVGTGDSWLGFSILILIWILFLVFDTPIFRNLALEEAGGSWLEFGIFVLI